MNELQGSYDQGKTDGCADTLLRLIAHRFGTPGDSVVARVRSGTPAEVESWIDWILDAETLDDLLGAPGTRLGTSPRTPLVIRRAGATFELRRIHDDDLRRLGRDAAAIEDDHAYWLHRGVPNEGARPLSLPEYFLGLSLRFGPSGRCFDDYKSSFCFPFHLVIAKGSTRGSYVLLVQDWKGGPATRLWRVNGNEPSAAHTIQPFVDAEFSRDDYRFVMNFLEGFLEGLLETARAPVPDFEHTVEAALLRYGYRGGQPFEQYFDDDEQFTQALARE